MTQTHWLRQDEHFQWVRGCGIRQYCPIVYAFSQATCTGCQAAAAHYFARLRKDLVTWDAVGQAQAFGI